MLGAGVQKTWEEKGVTLSLRAMDLARSLRIHGESCGLADGFISEYTYSIYMQNVSIGVSWRFGQRLQHRYRNVGDEDTDRLNSAGKSKGGF